jgi:RNA polymerase sigma factor (sigma-70 family)
LEHLSDQEIVSILKTGRPEDQVIPAWNCFIEKHMPVLDRRAKQWCSGSEAEADDCIQETWKSVVENIGSFEEGNLRGWLLRILRNKCIDSHRRKRRWDNDLHFGNLDDDDSIDPAQQKADAANPKPSAEDQYIEKTRLFSDNWKVLLRKYLGKDTDFYLEYRATPNRPNKDRTKFSRLSKKLHSEAIRDFVSSGNSLEDIMGPGEANVLTQKYSLGRREADIFHWMPLQGLKELHRLLFSAASKLFGWLLDKMPCDGN